MADCTYVEVLGVDLAMLWLVEVLLRDHHTFAEEVFMDLLAIRLGNQPAVMYQYDLLSISVGSSYILAVAFGGLRGDVLHNEAVKSKSSRWIKMALCVSASRQSEKTFAEMLGVHLTRLRVRCSLLSSLLRD